MPENNQHSNHLINESSPYLLQHAHNPVHWYPWNDEAWQKAEKENKLVLVSIGYSSCHWCHVMEYESFEDSTVAAIMNEHFICIKVDREERPDIDQIYMTAVQLMTGRGGWPLNCITLPDKRPIYGGTYYPKTQWINVLEQLAAYYKENENEANEYAGKLTSGIRQIELITLNVEDTALQSDIVNKMVIAWQKSFDTIEGGMNHAPKFPMPNNYEFLLHYADAAGDESVKKQVLLTLKKMAYGGIYDHVGGGFARYATDSKWKIPHFEKMLYDNAQLISLYSLAYKLTKEPLYKNVVYETMDFIDREMTSPEGGFYSALDADSEGEEGKFYVWKKPELQKLLGERFDLFADYYNINEIGVWESGNYILLRKEGEDAIAARHTISIEVLQGQIEACKKILLAERNKRIRPGLDDKELTSWNALMVTACCHAYNAFGEKKFLESAIKNARRNQLKFWRGNIKGYSHSFKNNKGSMNGFLEDYAFSIEAYIALYQSTFNEDWLRFAQEIADYAINHFFDSNSGMFFFTDKNQKDLIAQKMEISDNVIPSSNSSMAKGLYLLSVYWDNNTYGEMALQMMKNVADDMLKYPSGYSNWADLFMNLTSPFYEIVITGNEAMQIRNKLTQNYLPNTLLAGSVDGSSGLTLLEHRYLEGKNLIYVCEKGACKLPVETMDEAIQLIGNKK